MIKVIYNKVCGRCVQSEPLTSGMVGQSIHFEYSHDFDGLSVTAVFTDGKNTVDVVNPGNECIIPHEVLTTVGAMVKVGIYATKGNELVIPTIYAHIGVVLKGADPSGDVSIDPTLPIWAQTQALIGNLSQIETETKDSLVAAINEVKQTADANAAARHTHNNKSLLDSITEALKTAWNTASEWVITNGANVLSHLSDGAKHITAAERTKWNDKQDKLIAGDNITIAADGKTISATGGGGSTVELDTTLSEAGKAADAKAVGDALAGKQDTISDLEAIRTGAAKGATALQSVPSTYRTALAQDIIDSDLSDRIEVIEGKEAGWDAKSDFSGSYNDLTDKPIPLIGTTNELTPTQVYNAVSAGIPVKVQYIDGNFGIFSYTNFNAAENMNAIAANTIVYYNGVYMLGELLGNKSSNTWVFNITTLAQKTDIPKTLPNPNALTFTGAVTGSYDGSAPRSVNIPSAVTDDHINSLIDTKLGVIENGSY